MGGRTYAISEHTYAPRERTLRSQEATNPEGTLEKTSESNTENRGVTRLPDFEFKFDLGIVDKSEKREKSRLYHAIDALDAKLGKGKVMLAAASLVLSPTQPTQTTAQKSR